MTSAPRIRLKVGFAVLACVTGLAACGGSTPSSHSSTTTTSRSEGPGDVAICQLVAKATGAYNAKDYVAWKADMLQIAGMADSAQNATVKQYADEAKGGSVRNRRRQRP